VLLELAKPVAFAPAGNPVRCNLIAKIPRRGPAS
jgi:hypothetical protein